MTTNSKSNNILLTEPLLSKNVESDFDNPLLEIFPQSPSQSPSGSPASVYPLGFMKFYDPIKKRHLLDGERMLTVVHQPSKQILCFSIEDLHDNYIINGIQTIVTPFGRFLINADREAEIRNLYYLG